MVTILELLTKKINAKVWHLPGRHSGQHGVIPATEEGVIIMNVHYIHKAHIDRVIDGDTSDVTVHLGFRITTYQRLRLVGVDTPETQGPERPEGLKVK